jgi:hypothetical protein
MPDKAENMSWYRICQVTTMDYVTPCDYVMFVHVCVLDLPDSMFHVCFMFNIHSMFHVCSTFHLDVLYLTHRHHYDIIRLPIN